MSPLLLWVALFVVGGYFIFSLDKKVMQQPSEPGVINTLKKCYNAVKLTYIKKGIDLAGGSYLVLGVEIEKALDDKLAAEMRSFDSLFKSRELKVLPKTKEVKDRAIILTFDNDSAARTCFNMMQEAKAHTLEAKVTETVVKLTLAPELEQRIRVGAVEQAVNVLNNRLGNYGVEGIVVQQHGERQVVVQLPGIDDPERVKELISKTAHLEFKIVERVAASREAVLDMFDGELPSDKMAVPGKREIGESGVEEPVRWYLVSAFPDMTGDRMVDAHVTRDQYNKIAVSFKLDGAGAHEFADLTTNNSGKQLGIIIDNTMISAPNIHEPITGGSGIITGIASQKEALDLSIVLKSGSLQAPLRFEQESRIGASLGHDSIYKGFMSCLVALLLLFCFSLLYYKIPGIFAIITLLANMFLVLIFLSYFRGTLSLPGIAGMVLAIGMAIDASILIYEKTKEELHNGSPFRKALMDGFSGVIPVILDSNISTFLTGLVLFQFGGPAVRNFAVTLMLGIVATVFTGIFFLKSMYLFLLDNFDLKSLKF
jgi:preprotein translocase subunit SecD